MLPRNLARFALWLAGTALLLAIALVPRAAAAAILPACENHPITAMPVEWLADAGARAVVPLDACVAGEAPRDDDVGDTRIAAMCDDRGASVVAPPRLLPVVDARIDAAPSCGTEIAGPACGPGPNDAPLGPAPFATVEPGMFGGDLLVPPASSVLGPPFSVDASEARRGVTRDIEHPPR